MPRKKLLINDAGRECSRCDTFKGWDEFHSSGKGARGKAPVCKLCRQDINRRNSPSNGFHEGFSLDHQRFILGQYSRVSGHG